MTNTDTAKPSPSPPTQSPTPPNPEAAATAATEPPKRHDKHGRFVATKRSRQGKEIVDG
jgi:hypothetical protein